MEQEKKIIEQFIENRTEQEPSKERKEGKKEIVEKIDPQTTVSSTIAKDEQDKEVSEIEKLKFSGKVERLFKLAEIKNLFYAIEVARKTGDGYLIDVFRDRLAENNYYKKFLK